MAIEQTPRAGIPSKVKLNPEGDKPPVVDNLTESAEGDARLKRGSTSTTMGQDLTLERHDYTESTAGIIGRLPQGSKNMLGIN